MSEELREGRQLTYVITSVSENSQAGFAVNLKDTLPGMALYDCQEIVITMENGPSSSIPWAKCVSRGGAVHMVNLSHAAGLGFREEGE